MVISRYVLVTLCGILLEPTSSQHQTPDRRPYGPLMCLHLCHQISGCSQIAFVTTDLACYVTDVDDIRRTGDVHVIGHQKMKDIPAGNKTTLKVCGESAMQIRTKAKGMKCVKAKKYKSVTMLVYNSDDPSISVLDIKSKSLQKLFDISFLYTADIVYDEVFDRLIYYLLLKRQILSHGLDGEPVKVLRKRVSVASLALDGKRQLLFYITTSGHVCRHDINDGSIIKLVKMLLFRHITLDPNKETFYMHKRRTVLRGRYNSTMLKKVGSGKIINDIALDYVNEVLYVVDGRILKKMLLTQNSTTVLITFDISPARLFFHRNSVFYTIKSIHETKLGVLEGGGYKFLHSFHGSANSRFYICGMK